MPLTSRVRAGHVAQPATAQSDRATLFLRAREVLREAENKLTRAEVESWLAVKFTVYNEIVDGIAMFVSLRKAYPHEGCYYAIICALNFLKYACVLFV
jgi:hypothetical protein